MNILTVKRFFHNLRSLCWSQLRDNKRLKYKARIYVGVSFFILDKNDTKIGRNIDNIEYPFVYVFDINKKEIFVKNSLDVLIKKHLSRFSKYIFDEGRIKLVINDDTNLFITDFTFIIKK